MDPSHVTSACEAWIGVKVEAAKAKVKDETLCSRYHYILLRREEKEGVGGDGF